MSSPFAPTFPSSRRVALVLAALLFVVAAPSLMADPHLPRGPEEAELFAPDLDEFTEPDQRIMPLHEVTKRATDRFRGRLIAARLRPPTPAERSRGVELVHELRLLTKDRDVLLIRLDAHSGAFLEVRGAGLTRARRHSGETK